MLPPHVFWEVVSGKRKDPLAGLLRVGLALTELPYTFAVRVRNRSYDWGVAKVHQVGVPVVCVGNLTLGGTGKTPMVHYLADEFRRRGVRVAIVSRGYGGASGERNDEAKELFEKLPSVPHVQDADRVAAANRAIDQFDAELIILDDGFQHRRLARDLDIVLIDATEPFGLNRVFPRGMLREPVEGLARAQIVGLSRADLIAADERTAIRQRVRTINPGASWVELAHVPSRLHGRIDDREIGELNGQEVLAFCGIGNPAGFRRTLEACGAAIVDFRAFPDHHEYSDDDVETLRTWVQQHDCETVICTHKDLVKVDIEQLAGTPLFALMVELEVIEGESQLHDRLELLLQAASGR